jgi:hypothetical protein
METAIIPFKTDAPLLAPTRAGSGSSGTQPLALGYSNAPTSTAWGFTGTQTVAWQLLDDPTVVHYFPNVLPAPMPTGIVIPFGLQPVTQALAKNSVEITLHQLPGAMQPLALTLTAFGFFSMNAFFSLKLSETAARVPVRPKSWALPDIVPEYTSSQQIFDAIQALYLSHNTPRDRQIAERLTALYRAALEEDETVHPASISQFTGFFLAHPELGFPRITLTPDGTLRARWIRGQGNFVAIEFTGKPEAKLVAEIPGLVPPMHFSHVPLTNIIAIVQDMGGSFA